MAESAFYPKTLKSNYSTSRKDFIAITLLPIHIQIKTLLGHEICNRKLLAVNTGKRNTLGENAVNVDTRVSMLCHECLCTSESAYSLKVVPLSGYAYQCVLEINCVECTPIFRKLFCLERDFRIEFKFFIWREWKRTINKTKNLKKDYDCEIHSFKIRV